MKEEPEAIQFADDRPMSLDDDLYQWALDAESLIRALQSRLESLEKDAARYREYKENSHIRFSLFSGRYRADNGFSVLTDWIESFDECFDTAMQANKGE